MLELRALRYSENLDERPQSRRYPMSNLVQRLGPVYLYKPRRGPFLSNLLLQRYMQPSGLTGRLFVFIGKFQPVTLYHWTLNRTKLKAKGGFPSQQDRHSDDELGVWLTDQITGDPESINPEMRIVIVEMPEEDILQYEETNKGSGYRAFKIPAGIANQYKLEFPTLYIDRGVYKAIPF